MAAGNLLASSINWAMKNPRKTLGAIGAFGGFIGSGGSGWGALAGGALGVYGGGKGGFRKGWGTSATGERLAQWAPDFSLAMKGRTATGISNKVARLEGKFAGKAFVAAGIVGRDQKALGLIADDYSRRLSAFNKLQGNITRSGARNATRVGLRSAAIGAMGAGIGMGTGIISHAIGASFASDKNYHYGAVFSGMGGNYGGR